MAIFMVRILLFVVLFFVSCSFDGGEWNRHYDYAKNELTWQIYINASCPEENEDKNDEFSTTLSHPWRINETFYSSFADGRVEGMSELSAIDYATEKACYTYYKLYPLHFKDKIKK